MRWDALPDFLCTSWVSHTSVLVGSLWVDAGRTESAIGLGRILRTVDYRSFSFWSRADDNVFASLPLVFGLSGSSTLNFDVHLHVRCFRQQAQVFTLIHKADDS